MDDGKGDKKEQKGKTKKHSTNIIASFFINTKIASKSNAYSVSAAKKIKTACN